MKMQPVDWSKLLHFKVGESDQQGRPAFPLPYMMDKDLMCRLDRMRSVVGQPFIIHETTGGVHTEPLHGLGLAIDGHFKGLSAIEQYLYAEQWCWPGLGFYPFWNDPGIHIDMRRLVANAKGARWWRDDQGQYHPITPNVIINVIL